MAEYTWSSDIGLRTRINCPSEHTVLGQYQVDVAGANRVVADAGLTLPSFTGATIQTDNLNFFRGVVGDQR